MSPEEPSMIYEYWQHKNTGEIYAVQIDDTATDILGICGPLHYSEATPENLEAGDFNFDTEDLEWAHDADVDGTFALYQPQ